jgi:hypothetical protein
MNVGQGRETKGTHVEYGQANSEFDVILKFSIKDSHPLWQAAAQRLRERGLDADDIDETLGPIEDPAIRDCLLTLVMPDPIDGCRLQEVDAYQGGMTPVVAQAAIALPPQERKIPSPSRDHIVEDDADWRTGLDVPSLCVAGALPGAELVSALPN